MAKTYELPLSRNYVSDWTVVQAVREFLQNAIDSDSPFSYGYSEGSKILDINSIYSNLPVQSLILGATTKAHDDKKIGQFGEGYKIALLVLTRNNKRVQIFNDGMVWEPKFAKSRQFGVETMHIEERRANKTEPRDGLVFRIHDVFGYDMEQIRNSCLQMQSGKEIGGFIPTPHGQILFDKPRHVFVNGLLVTNTANLRYGYNFDPEEIKLDRDRSTVEGWDLYNGTMKLWFSKASNAEVMERIIDMLENPNKGQDLYYAEFSTPEIVKEALVKSFKEKHPGSIPVSKREDLENLLARGFQKVVYVDRTHGEILLSHSKIQEERNLQIAQPNPSDQLKAFFDNKRSIWEPEDVQAFEALMAKASNWKA